jgi:thiosulfate dehydrogenase [quinone] large subunit
MKPRIVALAAVRWYLAYVWLTASVEKLRSPDWTNTGDAVLSFWERAVTVPKPPAQPPVSFRWYRSLLRVLIRKRLHKTFAKLILATQVVVGLAMLTGLQVRCAALAGLMLNLNFSLAGGRGHNPVMLIAQTLLVMDRAQASKARLDTESRRK